MSVKNKILVCLAISMGFVGIFCTGLWLVTRHLDDFQDDFLNAVYAGDIKKVETMLIAGQNPNKRDGYGNNPMTLAAYAGHSDILKLLLKHGAKIDSQDDSGMTPLHCAVYNNRIESGRLLVKENAEVDIKNRYGVTPLSMAVGKGYLSMATELLDAGADVSSPDQRGWQPIHQALRSNGIDSTRRPGSRSSHCYSTMELTQMRSILEDGRRTPSTIASLAIARRSSQTVETPPSRLRTTTASPRSQIC